jgi:hypothetical protein
VSGADVAENYFSQMDLGPGDVVCLDRENDGIVPSEKADDLLAIGVISTKSGVLLNAESNGENHRAGMLAYPVALHGRVPCKVVDENGAIKRGDLLTSSSTTGHAMKALPVKVGELEIYRPGTIIGKALESHSSGKGMIEVLITGN